jgi:hypothetical protein
MAIQTLLTPVNIEWDDSAVIVFSYVKPDGQKVFSGFNHQIPSAPSGAGLQIQVTNILIHVQQESVQVTADPQTWVETLKNAHRSRNPVGIVFDDSAFVVYTTLTNQDFELLTLFSLSG